jgi:hypothetical protein
MHRFGTTTRDGSGSAISPVNLLFLLDLLSRVFERLYIIPVTPMIPYTATCSGHFKTHDECAALGEGFVAHFFLGCMGIECSYVFLNNATCLQRAHGSQPWRAIALSSPHSRQHDLGCELGITAMQCTVVDLSNALKKVNEFFINLVHIFDLYDIDLKRLNFQVH